MFRERKGLIGGKVRCGVVGNKKVKGNYGFENIRICERLRHDT